MSTGDKYSDEKLHMFIDDEMNNSDRARMMEAINKDEQLSNRVCELMQLKDTVRLAYNELPESSQRTSHSDTAFLTGSWMNGYRGYQNSRLRAKCAGLWMWIRRIIEPDQN